MTALKNTMLGLPRSIKIAVVMSVDLYLCAFSVWASFFLRLEQWWPLKSGHLYALIVSIFLAIPIFFIYDFYRAIFRYLGSSVFKAMVGSFTVYSVLYFFLFTLVGIEGVPRSVGVIQPMLLFFFVGTSRYLIRHWLGEKNLIKRSSNNSSSALIYGAGSFGRHLAATFSYNEDAHLLGFIDDDSLLRGRDINGVKVYGPNSIESLVKKNNITDIFIAIPNISRVRKSQIFNELKDYGVRIRSLPSLNDLVYGIGDANQLDNLDMNDLLGRNVVPPDLALLKRNICNKVIVVTGAGGSIGSELCRNILAYLPKKIILIDHCEYSLYLINEELKKKITDFEKDRAEIHGDNKSDLDSKLKSSIKVESYLTSVRDEGMMLKIFSEVHPEIVFHAAAYKHVPLLEHNIEVAIKNNIFGTLSCAKISLRTGVSRFILISTDKAVRPTNVMGATKRVAELILQGISENAINSGHKTIFTMVRFGNVLGSSGSVVPLFKSQIKAGGPITLTHRDVSRYFMTIPEAAQLVIQAGAMAIGGDVFFLDMGAPVRIYDLARNMIFLSGLLVKDNFHPHGNIKIEETGLRPGEKLYEELLIGGNPSPTNHPKIMKAHEEYVEFLELEKELSKLSLAIEAHDYDQLHKILNKLVPNYCSNN